MWVSVFGKLKVKTGLRTVCKCASRRTPYLADICSKSKKRNTRAIGEICSKLSINTSDLCQWCCSGVFLLLALRSFHTLFWCFHCLLWTSEFRADTGYIQLCTRTEIEFDFWHFSGTSSRFLKEKFSQFSSGKEISKRKVDQCEKIISQIIRIFNVLFCKVSEYALCTAQNMKVSVKDFFSKCNQI